MAELDGMASAFRCFRIRSCIGVRGAPYMLDDMDWMDRMDSDRWARPGLRAAFAFARRRLRLGSGLWSGWQAGMPTPHPPLSRNEPNWL